MSSLIFGISLKYFLTFLRNNLIVFVSFLLILFFYFPSLRFDYVGLDDVQLVLRRVDYLGNPANIFNSFKEGVMYWFEKDAFFYRPILTISFVLDGMIFGKNFWGYHLSNIFYHIVSVMLVFKFLVKLGTKKIIAELLSFLFSIHPVFTQAIVWVPGRNDTLLLIFVISSLFYFINYLYSGCFKDLAFFSFFFFLSVFTKETAAITLLIFALYYLLILKDKNIKNFKRMLMLLLLSLLFIFLWYFMARLFSDIGGGYWFLIVSTNWATFLYKEVLPAYLVYLGKIFLPISLSVLPLVVNNFLNVKLGIIFSSLLICIFARSSGKRNVLLFGSLWFLIFLFPALIKVMVNEPLIIYEHRLYLPFVGILIFFSQLRLLEILLQRRTIFYSILIFFSFVYFFINRSHIYKFRDSVTFWEAAYSTSSDIFVASVGLSAEYLRKGDFDKAEEVLKNLERIKPDSEISHLGFASLYYNKGEFDKARTELGKVLEKNSKSVRAMEYLAAIEFKVGNYDQAEVYYLQAIALDDNNVNLLMDLVNLYFRQGRIDDAKAVYTRVKELGAPF